MHRGDLYVYFFKVKLINSFQIRRSECIWNNTSKNNLIVSKVMQYMVPTQIEKKVKWENSNLDKQSKLIYVNPLTWKWNPRKSSNPHTDLK